MEWNHKWYKLGLRYICLFVFRIYIVYIMYIMYIMYIVYVVTNVFFLFLLYLLQNHKPLRKYIYINLVQYVYKWILYLTLSLSSFSCVYVYRGKSNKTKISLFFALDFRSSSFLLTFLSHNLDTKERKEPTSIERRWRKMSIHC